MTAITSFHGEFRFLSNFSPAVVLFDGDVYDTVEHAYQAAKTVDREQRARIRAALTPGIAKRLGRRVTMRPDWDTVKLGVMEDLLRQKFTRTAYTPALLRTGGRDLIEGNTWGDRFWGVCNGSGLNHLGELLMKIRDELKCEDLL